MTSKVPFVQEMIKDKQEDDLIFKKFDISWMTNQGSALQGEFRTDLKIENLKKTVEQFKYHIGFLSETNDRLVMTNRRLREDLDDIKN